MDEAYKYIDLNNNQNSSFDRLQRIDIPDYPDYATGEALLKRVTIIFCVPPTVHQYIFQHT